MSSYNFAPPRYSYSDYKNWKEDWELVNGYPYQLNPVATQKYSALRVALIHQSTISLNKDNRDDCEVYHRIDWKINDYTVIRPDFMIVCNKIKLEYLDFPPSLIIEILSPNNQKISRTIKFELYRENGVKYYLMVDVQKQEVEVYQLIDNFYKQVSISTFQIDKNCVLNLDFNALWK